MLIFVFAAIGAANNNLNNLNNSLLSPTYSSSPDDGSTDGSIQTTDQACTLLNSEVSDSATALSDNFSELESNPAAAMNALQNLSDDFTTAEGELTNPDVLEAATQANQDLETMIADIQAFQTDPSVGTDTIVADSKAVQTSFSAIGTLCP